MTTHRMLQGALTLFVVGTVSVASAQTRGMGRMMSPMYDVKSETTVKAVVESVETMTGGGHRDGGMGAGMGGTHLTVKTDTETVVVHVGPASYLAEKHVSLAKGDAIEILGSRVTMGGRAVVIAKRITKGDSVWLFRDPSGAPLWSGHGRGQ